MTSTLQNAGAASEPSSFAPLHTNRIFTGYYTNRSALRDGATSNAQERAGYGRQDSIWEGRNTEISTRLTLIRRPGNTIYNNASITPIKRFYSFNTFTTSSERIFVMADNGTDVVDVTGPSSYISIWTKKPGAGTTYFSSIGNILYFTDGVENRQYNQTTNHNWPWGIDTPALAPLAVQQPRPNPYPNWTPNTAHAFYVPVAPYGTVNPAYANNVAIIDPAQNLQLFGFLGIMNAGAPPKTGTLGNAAPSAWGSNIGDETADGSIHWTCWGSSVWEANPHRNVGEMCVISPVNPPPGTPLYLMFVCTTPGDTGMPPQPNWPLGVGQQVAEGDAIWQNVGAALQWSDIGTPGGNAITTAPEIVDANGYLQAIYQQGRTAPTQPTWVEQPGALTTETGTTLIWQNSGPFAAPGTAPTRYGYAFKNSDVKDIGNMSPPSNPITIVQGNEVEVRGNAPTQEGDDTVVIYRTAQGGSTFLYLDEIPAPPINGPDWTYIDNKPDSELNPAIQAQVDGQGTPLPEGASCIEYHLGRNFVGVGNVVYVASGPDAIASTSSGQAGFNTTFTAQSKITRFWVTSLGLVVFTVRDSYIILGSATDNDPLYMVKFIPRLPLLSYDCMAEQNTTAFLLLGTRMIVALDPSSGILEASFQISNIVQGFDPSSAYLTFHSEASSENALYLSDGVSQWVRMAATSAPETGANWSPIAAIVDGFSAVQSIEVEPGIFRLLMGPWPTGGPIRQRDLASRTDVTGNTTTSPYPAWATFGSIVLASPGQLAAIAFITLDSEAIGTPAAVSVLMDEIRPTAAVPFEKLRRTRQDPPLLPPSKTLYSDRFSLLQKQRPVWCRHFQMRIDWPEEAAANELIGFTIFGQIWQEFRSQ